MYVSHSSRLPISINTVIITCTTIPIMSPRTRRFLGVAITATTSTLTSPCHAFATPAFTTSRRAVLDKTSRASPATASTTRLNEKTGNLHGESSCFLPLLQNDDEYIAPRVVQVRTCQQLGLLDTLCTFH